MLDPKGAGVDLIADKGKFDGDVFHHGVKNGIRTEVGGTNVVAENDWSGWETNAKFGQKGADPQELGGGSRDGAIFRFGGGPGD